MALSAESAWISSFAAAMGPTATNSWAASLANWCGDEADSMELSAITGATFTFNRATFTSELLSNVSPSADQAAALQKFVDAWGVAVMASTLSVAGGSAFGFSAIVATGTPSNISAAKAVVTAAISGPPTDDIMASKLPPAFRDGFLALMYSVSGVGVPPSPPPPIAPFAGVSGTM